MPTLGVGLWTRLTSNVWQVSFQNCLLWNEKYNKKIKIISKIHLNSINNIDKQVSVGWYPLCVMELC